MNTNNIRTCSVLAAALFGASASLAADIQYAADGVSGIYCGRGFGVTVFVATPSSGATIQYSTSQDGPWRDEPIEYTNACTATPIWFKISADGYTSVTNSKTVTIEQKQLTSGNVWLYFPSGDYVYDGTEKKPECRFVDGRPSIITSNDFDVVFTDNVNAGTAKATFVGKRNYTGTVEEEFDIYPAMFPLDDDEEPGEGEVPGDGESKFDTTSVYDGQGHTIDTNALVTAFNALVDGGCEAWYVSEEADVVSDIPPWSATPPMYTNVGVYRVLYKVTKPNYEDYEHVAMVTITPRPLVIGAEAKTKTFGSGDPPLTYTNSALCGTDRITGTLTRDDDETVGAHPILQGSLTAGDNYEITYVGADLTINPATIHYAASGSTGTYCGLGFGIAVDVATPSSGAAIQYATSSTGPWQDAEIKYTNACAATPIWFKISAEGYTSVTNSKTVTIARKRLTSDFVWLVFPPEDYVYDGAAKTPGHGCADGNPSIITSNDFDVVFMDNVNAGTAKATFTGKRNYTGTVEEEFDIGKAPLVIGAEAKTKAFGADDPPLTYTNSALAGTDSITGAPARDAGEAVGAYAIRQGTLSAGDNYELTFIGADFTVVAPSNAVWYVDATNGVDTADGFSWATAKKTIQAALDLAEDGNQIIVTNGVYTKEGNTPWAVVFNARNVDVLIRSVNGPETTIIDGLGARRCVKMASDDAPDLFGLGFRGSIEGFTLQNGFSTNCGGASHALLRHCIIKKSKGVTDSGGVAICLAENCLIVDNSTDGQDDTRHTGGAARGSVLINCTVANNSNENLSNDSICSGGIIDCVAVNTIISGNFLVGEVNEAADVVATNSCFADAPDENGNIAIDPLFVDAAHGDYRLAMGSPCIDAGDNAFAPAGTDLAGDPRIVGNAVDMGCYECQTISLSSPSITVALEGGPFTYDGTAHEPKAAVTNGTVALVAERDYTVSYLDNVNAGTAKAIVTGIGAYVGSRTNEFEITQRPLAIAADPQTKRRGENDPPLTYTADPLIAGDSFSGNLERESGETNGVYAITIGSLTAGDNYEIAFTGASLTISDDVPQLPGATLRWKFAASVGRYFAQVSIPAQAGYSESLGDLAFLFADRKSADGTVCAQLWDAATQAPCPILVTDSGVAYRGVPLDASAFSGKADGTRVVFGVSDATFAEPRKIVPAGERQVGLYVRKRVTPASGNETTAEVEDFIGYLTWTTDGTRHYLPIVEGGNSSTPGTSTSKSSTATGHSAPSSYTIEFDANGGTGSMAVQTLACGRAAELRKNAFSRKGYVFLGWATKRGGAVKYKNGAQVKNLAEAGKTVKLHAAWAKKAYMVAFYGTYGDVSGKMAKQTFAYGKAKKLSANKFKRDGYVFKGWAKSKALAKRGRVAYRDRKAVKNLTATGRTVKLYAVWKRKR